MSQTVKPRHRMTTSHVNKQRRYRLSKVGYAWLSLITCCVITLVLQIISMGTKEHLLGEAGDVLNINGVVYHGYIRRTYSIFHQCTSPALSQTSLTKTRVPTSCVNPTSSCKQTADRIRFIQAASIIALVFTAIPFIMMLVMVGSRPLRSSNPLIVSMIVMVGIAFGFRMTLWSLILDFITNTSLCNNAFPIISGVAMPRYGSSFVVELISWIFLFLTWILLFVIVALQNGFLRTGISSSTSSSSSSSSTSEGEKDGASKRNRSKTDATEDNATEAF